MYRLFQNPWQGTRTVSDFLKLRQQARRIAREREAWDDGMLMPHYPELDTFDPICYSWRRPTLQ